MKFSEILDQRSAFIERLSSIKANNLPEDFTWYGYDILANFDHLNRIIDESNETIFEKTANLPMADIGAADGDLSFFLESLGYQLDIIDWPRTNWNGLRGAKKLKGLMGSSIGIHEIDLDSQFNLPQAEYGLTFFLGILYHLKNPYFALEKLAKHSHYCFLSTRIAQVTADHQHRLKDIPVAYLLAPEECGNDATNFWIFSITGLKRILDRCGWDIVRLDTVGCTVNSDPSHPDADERAFALLKSRYF